MVRVFALPCFRSSFARYFTASGFLLRKRTAASEKAHLRWALPIFLPDEPIIFPADSLADFTSLQYETKSCTLGKRLISWISYRMTRPRILPIPGIDRRRK